QVLPRDARGLRIRELDGTLDARHLDRTRQLRVPAEEGADVPVPRLLPDLLRHVDREEVTGLEERLDGVHADVIRVDMPWLLPAELLDGGPRRLEHAGGIRSDEGVLPMRLVPHGHHVTTQLGELLECAQLMLRLLA